MIWKIVVILSRFFGNLYLGMTVRRVIMVLGMAVGLLQASGQVSSVATTDVDTTSVRQHVDSIPM